MITKPNNGLSDDPILISALEHYTYCPRQFALIHIEQEFEDNVHTTRLGRLAASH
jgi:CRISPR-associated exonuclease Cas4